MNDMTWTGVNQSASWEDTMEVARKYLDRGHHVMLVTQRFGIRTPEHDVIEYEVYVEGL